MSEPNRRERRTYLLVELCRDLDVEREFVVRCLREHWVVPADPAEGHLDEEDLARLRLIRDLSRDLGVNDAAIPIILHLVDQLNAIRRAARSRAA